MRAFVENGVWRRPQATPVAMSGGATLRASALAAGLSLLLGALAQQGGADRTAEPARPARIVVAAAPEMVRSTPASPIPERVPAVSLPGPVASPATVAAIPAAAPRPAPPTVVEPTALSLDGRIVRLAHVAPPPAERMCRRLDGLAVRCADRAASYLELLLRGRAVACEPLPQTNDDAARGVCRIGGTDLAEQMVRQGWALADADAPERLRMAEAAAREQRLGIWRGE